MNWDNLRHFRALAAAGSLSAAARMLSVEHATVARRVATLEEFLGIPLVDRRGRRWTLTGEGERIAAIANKMEAEARAVERAADGARSELSGTVTISAPPALAAYLLTAPLVELQNRHPRLTIRLIGEARTASLYGGEADIAIRLTRPDSGDLTITKLGKMDFRLYATPSYLAVTTEENWRFIGYDEPFARAPQQAAIEAFAKGRSFSFYASNLELQQAAARSGGGIAALPDFMGEHDAALATVPSGGLLISRDIWLVVHSDLKRAAPIQVISKRLVAVFAGS
ncbi:LysR family transcriptional regulator [Rhizobium sp. VS19-DR104.2]|uniref:LysR family transcriptional regulator n=1 Tax=unclassified Rhizobium TaxID=2613769 RepID=UPI001C5AD051|nr:MULTISPECIES: LysR family transcriptional regulator [unclassified Rhizobium]MBZ5762484.1 LysR family transcriptional regulator [Rhizobium sp. VS19-DR96]MBZ5768501.1 LysR family transcriptional regulator [Rhizobium sp. VS19-DR129.2]MBZ5776019.1 LysR family transcriptional regulator [Rhizobium sp. VS19-DRK62.2]MBZ5787209.1 LysR family transcriptional regulator [Rhizobium sp. VS19-DR121]MBZ5804562.1 LysR family transcriptional regulator [Rhizobium sp. VS19-DR181]